MGNIEHLLEIARRRKEKKAPPQSKLEPHRDFILAAFSEKLPISTIRDVLREDCGLCVSYANLRCWILRRSKVKKGREIGGRDFSDGSLTLIGK